MKVVLAPDSFKGSLGAADAAAALARGWRSVRPDDEVVIVPMADGGEGTLDAVAAAVPGARRVPVRGVTGPDGRRRDAAFLLLPDGAAVVELAASSGLPLMVAPDPLGATTRGVGEVLAAALRTAPRRLLVGVGGSASTDGGAGLLAALGAVLVDDAGRPVPDGGAGLLRLARVDLSGLPEPPPGGVLVLTDVRNPLLGPDGAAAVYAPQKGASALQVALLEQGLRRLAEALGGDPATPGAGAAGGTAFGLLAGWRRVELVPGAGFVAAVVGLDRAVPGADLVVTGEGCFDATSTGGKATGEVLRLAARHDVATAVVAGRLADTTAAPDRALLLSLAELAGSAGEATRRAAHFLALAGAELARRA